MKLTWFGGTALRAYIGGRIVVIDPATATDAVRQQELLSGADRVVMLGEAGLPPVDAERWTPPRKSRAMDEVRDVELLTIAPDTCLIWGDSDPLLLVSNAIELPRLGRWADGAVFVLFGDRGARLAEAIFALGPAMPRQLLLAADSNSVERLFDRMFALDDRKAVEFSFSSLEPGLALEV